MASSHIRNFTGFIELLSISDNLDTRAISPRGSPQRRSCGSVTRMRCNSVEPALQLVERTKIGDSSSLTELVVLRSRFCNNAMDSVSSRKSGKVMSLYVSHAHVS